MTAEKFARRGCLLGRWLTTTDRVAAAAVYGSCGRPGARHRTGLTGRHQTANF